MKSLDPVVISLVSLGVAVTAAVVSLWNAVTSYRGLRRLLEQDKLSGAPLEIELINSFAKTIDERRIYGFDIAVINPTDRSQSLRALRLVLSIQMANGTTSKLVLQHDQSLEAKLEQIKNTFAIPESLASNAIRRAWGLFELSRQKLGGSVVQSYTIEVEDIGGEQVFKDVIFLTEKPSV
jgi:hypothetical protein